MENEDNCLGTLKDEDDWIDVTPSLRTKDDHSHQPEMHPPSILDHAQGRCQEGVEDYNDPESVGRSHFVPPLAGICDPVGTTDIQTDEMRLNLVRVIGNMLILR